MDLLEFSGTSEELCKSVDYKIDYIMFIILHHDIGFK